MCDGSQVVVDIVARSERIIVAAVAGQLLVFVDQEMPHVQMLMGGEPVAAFKKKYVASSSHELRA